MVENIQQDAALIKQAQTALSEGEANFNNLGSKLENELRSMANGWQGRGGDAFQTAHAAWKGKFDEINKILGQLSQALGSASRTATSADDEVSAQAASITSTVESSGYHF